MLKAGTHLAEHRAALGPVDTVKIQPYLNVWRTQVRAVTLSFPFSNSNFPVSHHPVLSPHPNRIPVNWVAFARATWTFASWGVDYLPTILSPFRLRFFVALNLKKGILDEVNPFLVQKYQFLLLLCCVCLLFNFFSFSFNWINNKEQIDHGNFVVD